MINYCIIGTAGHIDHGKSALIKALTGIETDTLKEEKERGISIELGFAYLDLSKEKRIGIVDVPGHEKFIKTMLAGAAGVDIVLLVIAANEGVMPQTIEHLDILRFLDIKKGIIIITKVDLATEEQIKNTRKDIIGLVEDSFLEKAPVILFSSEDYRGLEEIKNTIDIMSKDIETRDIHTPAIMPIDKVFTMSGFGTIVTGTLQKGIINTGDYLEVHPQQLEVKVRNIQVHKELKNQAFAGQRVAINLSSTSKEEIKRGNWLTAKSIFKASNMVDAHLTLLSHYPKNLKNKSRIRLHIGTNEVIGRINLIEKDIIKPEESQVIQFILERPIVASYGDRFVIRAYSPIETIGGGKILQTGIPKYKYGDKKIIQYLYKLNEGKEDERLEYEILNSPFQNYNNYKQKGQEEEVKGLLQRGKLILLNDYLIHWTTQENIKDTIINLVEEFHKNNHLRSGITQIEISNRITEKKYKNYLKGKILKDFLDKLVDQKKLGISKGKYKIESFEIKLNSRENDLIKKIYLKFEEDLFKPPSLEHIKKDFATYPELKEVLSYLMEQEILLSLQDELVFNIKAIKKAREIVIEEIEKHGKIAASQFRDRLNTSRKYAIAILEYFDSTGLTKRTGDDRVLLKRE